MKPDMICFSQIRWGAEAQRPQHLMRRAAKEQRVFFIEEPIYEPGSSHLAVDEIEPGALWRVVPKMPGGLSWREREETHRLLVHQLLDMHAVRDFTLFIDTPAAARFIRRLRPRLLIYDCLTRFGPGDGAMFTHETELIQQADLVISDSQQIFHPPGSPGSQQVFPGSLEVEHFFEARSGLSEPADQIGIPHPRLGFWGVINRLFNRGLVEAVADLRPEWNFILLGPITVDPGSLLNRNNVHYLSTRTYAELPAYLSGWDAAILPLAWWEPGANIAATQVPQYLAGGCPVAVTKAPLVARCFEGRKLVESADTPAGFIRAIERALARRKHQVEWLAQVDSQLAEGAWDLAWEWLSQSIDLALQRREQTRQAALFGETIPNAQGENNYG